jgi:outer membrane lipoprotein-sorting protein
MCGHNFVKAESVMPHAAAAQVTGKPASADDIKRIMAFWNGIKCLKTEIIQTTNNADKVTGTLWMRKGSAKKAKLRLDYQEDYKQRLVIRDGEVVLVDLNDNATSAYPVGMTPAELILQPDLHIGKDVQLIESLVDGDNIQLVLAQDKDNTAATLTLFFNVSYGVRLLRWRVLDIQGNTTDVELSSNATYINDPKLIPNSLF